MEYTFSIIRRMRVKKIKMLIDEEDFKFVDSEYLTLSAGYPCFCSGGNGKRKTTFLHRYLMQCPEDKTIDHINGNKLDCRKENLRICSMAENLRNKNLSDVEKTSEYKGVHWHKQGSWRVQLSVNSKTKHIGTFNNQLEAALAYDKAAIQYYGQYAKTNFPQPKSLNDCLDIAKNLVQKFKDTYAPESLFKYNIPVNGDTYGAPQPESMASVLQAYQNYLPGVAGATASSIPGIANAGLEAARGTQPGYNQLNLDQLQRFGVPLANAGAEVTNANALNGARTNLAQLNGPGGDAARAAVSLNRETNPDYYRAQDAASRGAESAVNAINLNGLSPGEQAATERANNQNLSGTGNLGLLNNTNSIANALNFGGAFNSKIGLMNNAVGSATNAANSAASNGGVNGVNIALGQPNPSTMGNFGTGTFTNTNAGTTAGSANNAFGLGSSLIGGMSSMNNAATSGAYGLANANAIPNYIPNVSC